MVTERNREREAAVEFGRRLGDPSFRRIVADHGCNADQDVVVALDETPAVEVFERVFTRCRPPALVAIRRPQACHGFVLVLVVPAADVDTASSETAPTDEKVSIGMLYDSMSAAHGLTFEIGPHFAYSIEPLKPPSELATA